MVGRVMDHVIKQIADEKSGERSWRYPSENDEEHSAKEQSERDAYNGRHDEAAGVLRIIVMHAMQEKMKLFPPAARGLVMKYPTMHRVFDQRPNEDAEREKSDYQPDRESALSKREIEQERYNRQINYERRRRMDMRQKFQQRAVEHPDRLILIRDETLRHTIKPSSISGPLQRTACACRFRAGSSVSERMLSASSRSARV